MNSYERFHCFRIHFQIGQILKGIVFVGEFNKINLKFEFWNIRPANKKYIIWKNGFAQQKRFSFPLVFACRPSQLIFWRKQPLYLVVLQDNFDLWVWIHFHH